MALQINIAAPDYPHARHTLPHQLSTWSSQVSRVVLTVETRRSHGRYAEGWDDHAVKLASLLEWAESTGNVDVIPVDYGEAPARHLASRFTGGLPVPAKDAHGAPYYAYLFGLQSAGTRFVLHADADILYGGRSETWMAEAMDLFERDETILVSGPLPGPPTLDGAPRRDVLEAAAGSQRFSSLPAATSTGTTLRFRHMSTRSFLIDLDRLAERVRAIPLHPKPPPRFSRVSPGVEPLEVCLSGAMQEAGAERVDFLGYEPGMWMLHPPYRSSDFFTRLPFIIKAVEAGEVPDEQRGDFDMNDSMIDWTKPRRAARRRDLSARAQRAMTTASERLYRR